MGNWLGSLLDASALSPHGFCLAWEPGLIWVHAGADLLTAAAYFSISFALIRLVRHRADILFGWVFWIFATFIAACGATHVVAVLVLWQPFYWFDGGIKLVTAGLSVATAILLWPLLPKLLALPSPAKLNGLNRQLAEEVVSRDRVAQQLRESEARFRAFFESSPDALGLLREEAAGEFLFQAVNPAMEHLLGLSRAVIEHQPQANWLGAAQGQAAQRRYRDCVAGGGMLRFEVEQELPDGRHILETALVSLHDPITGDLQMLESTRDVTERRGLESRLLQAQKMEAVGQLAGGVAHDFNNLLQAALISIERAEMATHADPDRVRDILSSAARILSQGSRLINQLLAVSRQKPLRAGRLQIGRVLGEVSDLLERAVGDAVNLVMTTDRNLWFSMIDPSQFESAILNLVINARDAMPRGGTLTITTANIRLDSVDATMLDLLPDDYVGLTLEDTGFGMDRAVLARVFEPFFTTKGIGKGSGLGLPQVYSFVRRSGGGITIDSKVSEGTQVRIYFPRCFQEAEPAPRDPKPAGGTRPVLPHATVLLVEDDLRVLNQTMLALQDMGLHVVPACDGPAAILQIRTHDDIDLLLSDVLLAGGMSGIEVAREVQRIHPRLPVLLVSGHAEEVLFEHGFCDEFEILAKPYKQAELLTALLRILAPQHP